MSRAPRQVEPDTAARSASGPGPREQALTDRSEWVSCHCCGKLFPAGNVVRFHGHPDDALCVTCVEWMHVRSRPIVRRLYPIWQLPARIRARAMRPEGYATGDYQG